ncbi:hypothetical protein SH139x_000343 [Planctomycetaceae bacterium SH139]
MSQVHSVATPWLRQRSQTPAMQFAVCFSAAVFVGLLAIALRLPALGESLWVDELHTAWVVAGSWEQVPPRAAIGNQTPWYFYGLWLWAQCFGSSEWALRFPSVLCTAVLAGWAVPWVARWSGRVSVGVVVGLLLAVERNAIFYGTEARCYGAVMLAVGLVAVCLVELRGGFPGCRGRGAGHCERPSWWAAGGLLLSTMAAVMLHVTALLAVAGLVALSLLLELVSMICGRREARQKLAAGANNPALAARPASRQLFLLIGGSASLGVLLALAMNWDLITDVWGRREQWNAFGRASRLAELWQIWPWGWLVLVPMIGWQISSIRWQLSVTPWKISSKCCSWGGVSWGVVLLLAVIGVTGVAWCVSYVGLAAVWHRRFLVGLLPPLCCASGYFWDRWRGGLASRGGWFVWIGQLVFCAVPLGLLATQGSIGKWAAGERRLVQRGEAWRELGTYLQTHRRGGDRLMLAAELLESNWIHDGWPPAVPRSLAETYVAYPFHGSYAASFATDEETIILGPLNRTLTQQQLGEQLAAWSAVSDQRQSAAGTVWLVTRRPRSKMRAYLSELLPRPTGELPAGDSLLGTTQLGIEYEVLAFHRLSLVRFSLPER